MHLFDTVHIGIDKLMHFSLFTIVSFTLGMFALVVPPSENGLLRLVTIGFTLSFIGIVEEYRQWFSPDRSTEFYDAIANIIGISAGLITPLLIYICIKLFSNKKKKRDLKNDRYAVSLLLATALIIAPILLGLNFITEYSPSAKGGETEKSNEQLTIPDH
ncbi:VanZ family protein [Pseudalkalibacillus caeni]|uniref:VanZ-like domain-containing protein n=1 Tax=Exobacillus caeni TaxID=2574798 RepID=A0A5R9F419_9BACL|nr:VanZ family protein [Pseudalkalibacillus caeni]TLS38442.1 hypothetical protein FCL54_04705 [Pseudalkalibacillus caeni]